MGRLFYIDGIIFHGDGRPYFLDTRTVVRILRVYTRESTSPPSSLPLMNPGYLPGKLMCVYHVFVRSWPLYQRNGVTFDKIGYYYPFLLSPQGVARPVLARCFVSSSFNCSSRDRRVFVELEEEGGKKKNGYSLRCSSPFLSLNKIFERGRGREREKRLGSIRVFSSTLKKKKRKIGGDETESLPPGRESSRRTKAASMSSRIRSHVQKKKGEKERRKGKKGKKEEVRARTWKEVGGGGRKVGGSGALGG